MSQWGQPQGFQYPMQTGFPQGNPQFQQNQQFQPQGPQLGQQQQQFQPSPSGFQQGGFGGQPGGLRPQATGFPMQNQPGFQQPQATGFPGGQQMMQSQPTGFVGGNFGQQGRPAPPPVPPLPTQFQGQNQGPGMMGGLQQPQPPNRFLSASPRLGGSGLVPQATGFAGRGPAPLVPQMTGFTDPRLQMMQQTFMPLNTSAPYTPGGMLQLPPSQNLQQSFQQYNQEQRGQSTQQISWALSKTEKKNYDKIFRSWDASGSGFISGQAALEVFGQSGLPQNELAKIWSLADIDDRGKLNIAEFHVAMGLIYRRLNGNSVPEVLPAELVPPSARDLDSSVDFLKDVLKHETRSKSPSGADSPISRLKQRSFNSSSTSLESRDATIYKHRDDEPPGGYYKPRSRHVDRDAIRRTDDDSPSSDLSDMKRQLANTAHMLDRDAEAYAKRSKEDEELDQEMSDLKYRVKRVQEDLDYISRGPRTASKEEEKRKLERELLGLLHERIPEVERKLKISEERKERERREWTRNRDRANDRFGRFDAKEESYSSRSRYDDRDRDRDRDYDRPASRGYDRDRDYRRSPSPRERRERDRSRDRDYDRPRSPAVRATLSSSPAPAALRAETPRTGPARSPAPDLKSMTPEQRRAHAQRLIQERRVALGLDAPPSATPVDTSIEDRLQQEKKEAEERAKADEKEREDRERARKERLEREKGPAPTPTTPVAAAAPPAPAPKAAPQPPKARGAAPPPPPTRTRVAPPKPAPAPVAAPKPPAAPPAPKEPEVDPEEEAFRAKEAAIKKQREERLARLRRLEEEEAEAERQEEERIKARIQAMKQKQAAPVKAPSPPPAVAAPPAPPPAPPAPPAPAVSASSPPTQKSTNPFSRMLEQHGPAAVSTPATPATPANGSNNPWARPQTVPPSIPTPSKSPAPPAVKTSYNTAPSSSIDDDWDDVKEKDDSDDSSDEDEIDKSRAARANIAQQLFGNMMPRPTSAAAGSSVPRSDAPSPGPLSAPPTAPPAPPPPAPPSAPAPPRAPAAPKAPIIASGPADVSALMSSIQGGARLRPTKTVDKSGPALSGKVLGDSAPPAHISSAPRPASPPQVAAPSHQDYSSPIPLDGGMESEPLSKANNRQSVDWMSNRAASDAGLASGLPNLPPMVEADEDEYEHVAPAIARIPSIQVNEPAAESSDLMSDIDKSTEYRARTLYAYDGDGPEDLSFPENAILVVNPSKTGGDWWFGTPVKGGKPGLFPQNYVEVFNASKAKALYDYTPDNADELPLSEGEIVTIIDKSEEEWWKAEREGKVLVVPAAYLEPVEGLVEGQHGSQSRSPPVVAAAQPREHIRSSDASALQRRQPIYIEETGSSDEADSSDGEYLSFNEGSDEEEGNDSELEDSEEDRMAREREREMVLAAAGLIVKTVEGVKPPPPRPRSRPVRRSSATEAGPSSSPDRRSPPEAPARKRPKPKRVFSKDKDLPPVPPDHEEEAEPANPAIQLDDAFARYESFKSRQLDDTTGANRLSVISTDSTRSVSPTASTFTMVNPPSPVVGSPAHSTTSSRDVQRDKDRPDNDNHHLSNFLNFLSKGKTSEAEPASRTVKNLAISGPMILGSVPPGSRSRAASPRNSVAAPSPSSPKGTPFQSMSISSPTAVRPPSTSAPSIISTGDDGASVSSFGSSWASLLDKTALDGIPTGERKRQEAIFELIHTETAYVRDLQLIVEVFYSSMLDILSHKEITVLFANIEDILLTNTAFLSSLEERQKECRLYVDRVGDILVNHFPNMGVYMEYCVNQQTANTVLQSLIQNKPSLVEQMNKLKENPATRNLNLASYLLQPMQRITRYPLLIKQIAHYTSTSDASDASEQTAIAEALDLSEKLLSSINEAIRDQEGSDTLRKLSEGGLWIGQGRLDLTAPTRYMGTRKLLKQGVVAKAKSGRQLKAFLCSDILVLTDQSGRNLYRMPIPLAHAQVKELTSTLRADDTGFQVVQLYPRGGETIGLKASSPKECRDWMKQIESASRRCRHAEERAARKGRR